MKASGNPLTPALSLSEGERENHSPSRRELATEDSSTTFGNLPKHALLFPLPRRGGEGQGEGARPSPSYLFASSVTTRREFLWRFGGGLGGIALAHLLGDENLLAVEPVQPALPHFPPKAKFVIQLFMNGGASQMDLFDHKPELFRRAGD